MKIKKGDLVQVITGKDKGKQGKVIAAYPRDERVLVEGVNRVKKHTKAGPTASGSQAGGIVTTEAPIHLSNVMLVDGKGTTRVGFKRVEATKRRPDGSTYTTTRSVRIARKSGDEI